MPRRIHLVPSFHYDVEYMRDYEVYLYLSMGIIKEVLNIMQERPKREKAVTDGKVRVTRRPWEIKTLVLR